MRARRLEAAGLGFDALEAGAGGRPLLLVHGFGGAKEDFADALDALAAEGWHVLAPDLRGHGGSDQPEGRESYSLELFTDDVLGLAAAVGWERFALLGHSMGGMVAQLVALRSPERVVGLVLMSTSHAAPEAISPGLVELGRQIVHQGGMELLVAVQRQMEGELGTPSHRRLLAERPGYREFNEAKTLASSSDMWLALVEEMFAQPDRLKALSGLDVPTLILVGAEDESFLGPCQRLAEAMPGARLVVFPDAGHLPQFEAPNAWWSALSGFLDEVGWRYDAEVRRPRA
ncbi:MAG: alpha/beta hydrolase [Actinomycetota bacterium]|nr:alpha/beta hydrolase [Actinomycetota bacterium]